MIKPLSHTAMLLPVRPSTQKNTHGVMTIKINTTLCQAFFIGRILQAGSAGRRQIFELVVFTALCMCTHLLGKSDQATAEHAGHSAGGWLTGQALGPQWLDWASVSGCRGLRDLISLGAIRPLRQLRSDSGHAIPQTTDHRSANDEPDRTLVAGHSQHRQMQKKPRISLIKACSTSHSSRELGQCSIGLSKHQALCCQILGSSCSDSWIIGPHI